MEGHDAKHLAYVSGLSALTASMCCLPSVIWVFFGGSSAIIAADKLSNDLYYSWVRFALYCLSFAMMSIGLVIFFRNRGICTIDDAKRERRRIVNTSLAVITITLLTYLLWNYVILEIIGIKLGLPWEESAFWNN